MRNQSFTDNKLTLNRTFFTVVAFSVYLTVAGTTALAAGQPFQKKLDEVVQEFKSKKSATDRNVIKQFGKYRNDDGNRAEELLKKEPWLSPKRLIVSENLCPGAYVATIDPNCVFACQETVGTTVAPFLQSTKQHFLVVYLRYYVKNQGLSD